MMGKLFSSRVWEGEEILLRVLASGRVFTVRRKFNSDFCVRGFAVFVGGRRVSPYRILGREDLENWLDTGELVEVKALGRSQSCCNDE
jgi:hypothetical protein